MAGPYSMLRGLAVAAPTRPAERERELGCNTTPGVAFSMFTRKPRRGGTDGSAGGPPQSPREGGASGTPSIIGPDLSIVGNLASDGEVQINGEVQGDIQAG